MISPAKRHYMRMQAAAGAARAADTGSMSMAGANAYELTLAQLTEDRRKLKAIQSIERKIELKHQLLPKYADYVAGVLSAGNGVQDDVLTTVMTWRIDIGDYAGAFDIARYVLTHDMPLPDRFERTSATVIAEEVAENAARALAADENFDLAVLQEAADITASFDMPDQVRAKLHKAIGQYMLRGVDLDAITAEGITTLQNALPQLQRALQLHDRCGVKKDIERVERLLKKHADPASAGTAD